MPRGRDVAAAGYGEYVAALWFTTEFRLSGRVGSDGAPDLEADVVVVVAVADGLVVVDGTDEAVVVAARK